MNWTGVKVLVTGSCGFIGSHLVERLVGLGADVRAFVHYNSFNNWGWIDTFPKDIRNNLEVFAGNIRDAYRVSKAVKDRKIVFHLASLIAIPYSYYSPESYVATNVVGTLNILQAAKESQVAKVVHTSTSEVYGTAQYVPIDERHPLQGQSPYSATKIGADMLAESFYRSFKLPVAICRPFNTYGPRQSARAVIPTIITQALRGEKSIRLGSVHPTRDFNYVGDTVAGFIRIAESRLSDGQVINIGSNKEISVGELADKIKQLMNVDVELIYDDERIRPKNSEVERLLADNKKARELLNWRPKVKLTAGLKQTIEWMQHNLDYYKPDIYNV